MFHVKLTKFKLFKNTPFVDFQNTVHFDSNEEREQYFMENFYSYQFLAPFNWIKDRSTVTVAVDYHELMGYNYLRFQTEGEEPFYAFIMKIEYVSSNSTKIYLAIDGIMTYTQGNVLETLDNIEVIREHLSETEYMARLPILKNNDDVLKTYTKRYIFSQKETFENLSVLIHSTVDLTSDFGDVDNPTFESSEGITFDNITSPVNLYWCDKTTFNTLMKKLAPYPWITQQFQKILLIPTDFIRENQLKEIKIANEIELSNVFTLKNNGHSAFIIPENVSVSMEKLLEIHSLNKNHLHLLRSEYTTNELYSWDGQQLFIDSGRLHNGLKFVMNGVIGYENKYAFYLQKYKSDIDSENANGVGLDTSFLNDAIILQDFNEVPILVDNYKLSMASNANQRNLAESKLVTNRMKNIIDPESSLQSKFYDAMSLVSNFSISNMFGKFNDEYEFYRNQKAEFADLALSTPTITSQSNGYGFQMANDLFGITLFIASPIRSEWQRIKKYYNLFGFQIEERKKLSNVHSMNICNYVQFKGNWTLDDVDVALIEAMKAQFENGVRLWHWKNFGVKNTVPWQQEVVNNERIG